MTQGLFESLNFEFCLLQVEVKEDGTSVVCVREAAFNFSLAALSRRILSLQ